MWALTEESRHVPCSSKGDDHDFIVSTFLIAVA